MSRPRPPLQLENAKVDPLGESRTYEKEINGVRHGVIETRYAIYPQQSGDLDVPPLRFTATAADNGEQPAGTPRVGRQVQVSSLPLRLTVKPIPAGYPADRPWLPARSLTLEEHWNPDPNSQPTQIGDSLTRNISVRAEGLSSTQLPPLPATEAAGLRRYPDQPLLRNEIGERGMVANLGYAGTGADHLARFHPVVAGPFATGGTAGGADWPKSTESGQYWHGDELWRAIGAIPPAEQELAPTGEASSLPPLYPK
ncbi:hypothetical protein WR25_23066 [Diploscapter pachys]|uniref:Uncharacterized protein n=1 Tax=Diploscapter pachys TaxID=2018661 RepID=A0A2A2KJC6_9BILA|nr:hypothetical protein WR25_23066 [Diploscapter pachys]